MKLRLASNADCARLLRWRNDPITVAMSRVANSVQRHAHEEWLRSVIADDQRVLLIAVENDEPVGTVRLDQTANDEWEISITVRPESRGLGVGAVMLRQAGEYTVRNLGAPTIVADVKEENTASRHLFEAAGYKYAGVTDGFRRYRLCGAHVSLRT